MPKTSKKVYELVGKALRDALERWGQDAAPAGDVIRDVAGAIATAFAQDGGDPTFNRSRFLASIETGRNRPSEQPGR